MMIMLMKKNMHLFHINFEDNLYQYHDHKFEHDRKEDQEE
jgi:hypothetical protein